MESYKFFSWRHMLIKTIITALFIEMSFLPFAHADNRLFPTDILNKGEIDARLAVEYDTHSNNVINQFIN